MVRQAYSISVIVSGDVNYTDPATSARIDSLIESLENSTYINQHLSKSWLHDFRTVTRAQVNQNMHKYISDQQVVFLLYGSLHMSLLALFKIIHQLNGQ